MGFDKWIFLDKLRTGVSEVQKGLKPELEGIKDGLDNVFANVESRGISVQNMHALVEQVKTKLPDGWYTKWKDNDDNLMWKNACDGAMGERQEIVKGFKGDKSELAFIMSWIIAGETVVDRQTAINVRDPLLKNDIGKLSRNVSMIRDDPGSVHKDGEDFLKPIDRQILYDKAILEIKNVFGVDDTEIKKAIDLLKKNLPDNLFKVLIVQKGEMLGDTFDAVVPFLNKSVGVHIYDRHLQLDFLDRLSWIMTANEIVEMEQSSIGNMFEIFDLTNDDMNVAASALFSDSSITVLNSIKDEPSEENFEALCQIVIPGLDSDKLKSMGENAQKRLIRLLFADFLGRMISQNKTGDVEK